MTREHLAAFRAVVVLRRRILAASGARDCPTTDYMAGVRRVQEAFGLFPDPAHPTPADWERWARLHAAVVRWSDQGGET